MAFLRALRDLFLSLKLTVTLLVLGMILIFVATLDQVNLGVWGVQEKYFHAFFSVIRVGPLFVPFPGGYCIGGLLLINLIVAHVWRLKFTWRKSGIQLTHAGLILLLVGELLSGLMQQSYTMRLTEGQTSNYSEHQRDYELAIIDTTDAKFDDVVAIPEEILSKLEPIQQPPLPFRVVPRQYFPNASLARRTDGANTPASPATQGVGPQVTVTPLPITYREDDRNVPAAYVELIGAEGSLGTWLVSPNLGSPQAFPYAGHNWKIVFRPARVYKPFAITLLETRHDVYPGTDIPKNFSSRIRIGAPGAADQREVLIYMNNPLRYEGLTFYQYQMDPGHNASVLQVVRNPSWILPYVACSMMTLGLCVQFLIHLVGFIQKRRVNTTAAESAA